MLPELLKAGYLGLIAAIVYYSYRAIISLNQSNRPTAHIVVITSMFFIVNLIASISGYLWASKELEATTVINNTASILDAQINNFSREYKESTLPIQNALNDVRDELKSSVLESNREQRMNEMERINNMLQDRDKAFSEKIKSLKSIFPDTPDK